MNKSLYLLSVLAGVSATAQISIEDKQDLSSAKEAVAKQVYNVPSNPSAAAQMPDSRWFGYTNWIREITEDQDYFENTFIWSVVPDSNVIWGITSDGDSIGAWLNGFGQTFDLNAEELEYLNSFNDRTVDSIGMPYAYFQNGDRVGQTDTLVVYLYEALNRNAQVFFTPDAGEDTVFFLTPPIELVGNSWTVPSNILRKKIEIPLSVSDTTSGGFITFPVEEAFNGVEANGVIAVAISFAPQTPYQDGDFIDDINDLLVYISEEEDDESPLFVESLNASFVVNEVSYLSTWETLYPMTGYTAPSALEHLEIEMYVTTQNLSTPELKNANISVAPNPTTGMINITGDQVQMVQLFDVLGNELQTVSGNEIESSSVAGAQASINIENRAKGFYFLKVTTKDNLSSTVKIVKK